MKKVHFRHFTFNSFFSSFTFSESRFCSAFIFSPHQGVHYLFIVTTLHICTLCISLLRRNATNVPDDNWSRNYDIAAVMFGKNPFGKRTDFCLFAPPTFVASTYFQLHTSTLLFHYTYSWKCAILPTQAEKESYCTYLSNCLLLYKNTADKIVYYEYISIWFRYNCNLILLPSHIFSTE